jgi:hypothetical protein
MSGLQKYNRFDDAAQTEVGDVAERRVFVVATHAGSQLRERGFASISRRRAHAAVQVTRTQLPLSQK